MNEDLKNIVGLYNFVDEATFRPKSRLVRYIDGQLFHSPILNMSAEMVQDLRAYMPQEDIEIQIISNILKEYKLEQYTLMNESDIQKASEQIEYLKKVILRDKKINEILNEYPI
jgi:hypothetical protein